MKKTLIILLVILALVLALLGALFVMRDRGGQSLANTDKQPELPQLPEAFEEIVEGDKEYSVKHNGKKYKYNNKMINLLLMGFDSDDVAKKNEFYGDGGQVDFLLLGCIDTENDTVRLISIPRDTLCDVEVFDVLGNSAGFERLPVSLSYAYGDGGEKSAELTVNAVSDLLYGLPIHSWYSVNVSAVTVVNDAVGGVEIVATEDNLPFLPSTVEAGDTVLLQGNYAHRFIVPRFDSSDALRRARHKQYLNAFIPKAKEAIKKNPLLIASIYNGISKYSFTSLTLDEILWLAGEVIDMNFDTEIITLKGEERVEGNINTLTLDENVLFETMLDIFYVEFE